MLLGFYLRSGVPTGWVSASEQTAEAYQKGPAKARKLQNTWSKPLIERNKELKLAICNHLQSIGKYVRAMDIVHFMTEPANLARFGLTKPVSLSTAQVWMHCLGYRWTKVPSGQFVDGHERRDVVDYRQTHFLPAMQGTDQYARQWDSKGNIVVVDAPLPPPSVLATEVPPPTTKHVVYWWHDESVFYAHARRTTRWVHKSEKAVPRAKGEGASLMVADFVSADYGWLRSPDGKTSTRVFFCPGKNRDGYFTHEEILAHATATMDLLQEHYPTEQHVFIFDNAPTHLKRAADALSARKMSKFPTQKDKLMFGVEQNVISANGKPVYSPDGKILKTKIRMGNAMFSNGSPQSLYFPDNHPTHPGAFKGMAVLLEERGFKHARQLNAQCPDFKCQPPALDCCCRRLLFNQPDFRDVETLLEAHCRARGFTVLFLPKFHCELNCIEQCWCYAKQVYRKFPPSSAEADLERNVRIALDSVPLATIHRYYTRSHRFMDAYRRGLSEKQAAWAAKKYHSHHVLPNDTEPTSSYLIALVVQVQRCDGSIGSLHIRCSGSDAKSVHPPNASITLK
ncbi:hypothetical protein GY45DRAFT_1349605 [Cubamyces sp. BRFM 1775]|nr:hypothetical protein GY45DRAFT_1349605 [Cubamyces sp. BRFM 1775]